MLYSYYKQYGNNIFVRYKKENDPKTYNKVIRDYKPILYTKTTEPTDTTSIYDYYLKPIEFDNIKAAKTFADQYKDVENFVIEGNNNYANQFIIDLYEGKSPDYTPEQLRYAALDIEVWSHDDKFPFPEEARHVINAITVYDSIERTFYTFALKHNETDQWIKSQANEAVKDLSVTYFGFETEDDLMRSFLSHMQDHQYDLVTGWNSEGFDMPYIVNRCNLLFGENYTKKMLSPFGIINLREVASKFGKTQLSVEIVGLPHLDYMEMYKKHTYTPRESYRLDFIAHAELGEKKLDYEESGNLQSLYVDDFQLFIDYNIQDVNLIVRLDEKLGLFSLVYAMSYYSLSNFEDTMGTVKIWEQLIAKYLYNQNQAPQFRHQPKEDRDFEGAFVKDVVPGRHHWVVSYDLNSLYPHCEMQYNIGPETHIATEDLPDELAAIKETYSFGDLLEKKVDLDCLKDHNLVMTPNFEFYRKDKMSFFSAIKRDLYTTRKQYKKKMIQAQSDQQKAETKEQKQELESLEAKLNSMQMGLKILLNGGYGAVANKHFLYYMVENAEAITLSGQLVNKWTAYGIEQFLKELFDNDKRTYWIAGDTDSVVGESLITVNGQSMKIEDYYNMVEGNYLKHDDFNEDWVKEVLETDLTPSVSDSFEYETKPIKYIMKHRVKKKMYRITVNGKSVEITGDHSLMVERDNKLISVKVDDIKSGDRLITN